MIAVRIVNINVYSLRLMDSIECWVSYSLIDLINGEGFHLEPNPSSHFHVEKTFHLSFFERCKLGSYTIFTSMTSVECSYKLDETLDRHVSCLCHLQCTSSLRMLNLFILAHSPCIQIFAIYILYRILLWQNPTTLSFGDFHTQDNIHLYAYYIITCTTKKKNKKKQLPSASIAFKVSLHYRSNTTLNAMRTNSTWAIQPFLGMAASLVYIFAMDWNPLISPERKRLPGPSKYNPVEIKTISE